MPHISADLITAGAAILAAVLSALTLALTGRRDERRWRREALTEVLIAFLDTTFKGAPAAAFDLVRQKRDPDQFRQGVADSHAVMVDALTRLRMLAGPKVVKTAEDFHEMQDQIYDAIYRPSDPLMSPRDFDELVATRKALRNRFIKLARKNLALRGATPINVRTLTNGPNMRDAVEKIPEMKIHFLNESAPKS